MARIETDKKENMITYNDNTMTSQYGQNRNRKKVKYYKIQR